MNKVDCGLGAMAASHSFRSDVGIRRCHGQENNSVASSEPGQNSVSSLGLSDGAANT